MSALITALWQRNKLGVAAAALPQVDQSRSQDYRAQAAECQKVANRWPDDLVKQQYEELARQWRALAEHAEGRR
jgi:hypothetical protein